MSSTVPSNDLAATVAALVVGQDSLDEGLVAVGVTAAEAREIASDARNRARHFEAMIDAVVSAAGLDDTDPGQASYADPVALRFQEARRRSEARRQRIAASGFRLIAGGQS